MSVWSGSADPSHNAGEISNDLQPPNSWPALAVSWQSVFGFLYWGAPLDKLGHNRSSSPFTTLANTAERKVVSTRARQPNYWPKRWFGANAYSAKFGVSNYTVKVFGLLLPCCGVLWSPWKIEMHQSVRVLSDRITRREKAKIKKKEEPVVS